MNTATFREKGEINLAIAFFRQNPIYVSVTKSIIFLLAPKSKAGNFINATANMPEHFFSLGLRFINKLKIK